MDNQVCLKYPEGVTFAELAGNLRAREVMRYGVMSVDRKEPIHHAVSLLARENIGCLPVTCNGQIYGMLSVKALLRSYHKDDYLPGVVEDYMTDKFISYDVEDRLSGITERLTESTFRHAPICIKKLLAGMISRSDLIQVFLNHANATMASSNKQHVKSRKLIAADAMKCGLHTLLPKATLIQAMTMIVEHHITGIPIVSPGMELLGIITEKDILHAIKNSNVTTTKVEDCMTPGVITFDPKSNLGEICECLLRHDFHRVPIVRQNILVGIISRTDILIARMKTFKV